MTLSDPTDLRIRATELLIDTQGNETRTLGAVEFGSDARPLFGPGPIAQNAAPFKFAMGAGLIEDGVPDLITQLTCADVLEDSIRRIFTDDSVSEIFAGENQLF